MLRRRLVCSYSNISGNFSLFRNFSLTLNNLALPDSSISKLQPFITKLAIEKARPRTFDPKFDDSPARAKIFPRPNPPQDVAQRFSPQLTETVSGPEDVQTQEDALRILTDVSRLPTSLKLKYAGEPTPLDHWKRTTRAAQRTTFGQYGTKSGVDPAICWPELNEVKEQLEIRAQYERPVDQSLRELAVQKAAHEVKRRAAMQSVEKGMSKMPQLIREHLRKMRNARKQAEEADANMKKLLDEAREFFGYEPLRGDLMFKRFAALRKLYDKQLATEMAGRKKVKLSSKESQRLALERSAAEIKQRLLDAASTSPSATSPAAEPSASASSAGSPATAASATSDPSATAAATAAAPGAVESASGKPVQTTASVGKRKKKSVPSQVSENSPALDKSTSDKN